MNLLINSLFFICITILSQSAIASVCEDCTLIEGERKISIISAIGDTARASDPNQFRCIRESGNLSSPNLGGIFGTGDVNCFRNPYYYECFEKKYKDFDLFIKENRSQPIVILTNGSITLRFTTNASLTELREVDIEQYRYENRSVNHGTIINPDYRDVNFGTILYKGKCTF